VLYRRMFRYLAAIAFPMAALIVIEAPVIVHLLYKSGFRQSVAPLQILTVALLVGFIYIPATRLMIASHREKQLARLLFVSFAVNLLANLILIRVWGANGSALARALSATVYFVLCDLYVNRQLLRTETLSVLLRVGICAGVLVALVLVLRPFSTLLAILVGLVVYAVLLIRLRCVDVGHLMALGHEYQAQMGKLTGRMTGSRTAPEVPDSEDPTKGAV
jgi:O-antigen/teichoic acid export membrane protein